MTPTPIPAVAAFDSDFEVFWFVGEVVDNAANEAALDAAVGRLTELVWPEVVCRVKGLVRERVAEAVSEIEDEGARMLKPLTCIAYTIVTPLEATGVLGRVVVAIPQGPEGVVDSYVNV